MKIENLALSDIAKQCNSRLELWEKILGNLGIRRFAEIGVWKGGFAEYILKNIPSIETYYMIDPWARLPDWNKPWNVDTEYFESVYKEAMEKTAFAGDKVNVLRGRTKDVADQIENGSLDFVYIDGDHTLRGITIDLQKAFLKVKDGGFIAGDDFTPSPWQHDVVYEPTLVCPYAVYFAEAMDMPIVALPFNQFLIHKSQAGFSFSDYSGKNYDLSLNKLHVPDNKKQKKPKGVLSRLRNRR